MYIDAFSGWALFKDKIIIAVFLTLSFFLIHQPSYAQDTSQQIKKWHAVETAKIRERISRYELKLEKARAAMAQAQKAYSLAKEQNDSAAAEIARDAYEISLKSKSRMEALIKKAIARLQTIESLYHKSGESHLAMTSFMRGDVRIMKNGVLVPFSADTPLLPGDVIQIGSGGFAEIMCTDGSKMRLDENTRLKLSSIDSERSSYELYMGRIEANIRKFLRREYSFFPVSSSCKCTGGVRGTQFVIENDPDGTTTFIVLDGEFEIMTLDRKETLLLLKKGQKALVNRDGEIEGPSEINLKEMKKWWERN